MFFLLLSNLDPDKLRQAVFQSLLKNYRHLYRVFSHDVTAAILVSQNN